MSTYQNKLNTLIIVPFLLVLTSCSSSINDLDQDNLELVINNFTLKQNKPNGDISWSIKSNKGIQSQYSENIKAINPVVTFFDEFNNKSTKYNNLISSLSKTLNSFCKPSNYSIYFW